MTGASLKFGLVVLATIAFQVIFYAQPLYNSGPTPDSRITRAAVLERAIGSSRPNDPNLFVATIGRFTRGADLRDRIPVLYAAAVVVVVAFLAGDLIRRMSLARVELLFAERLALAGGLGLPAISLMTQLLGLAGWLTRGTCAAAAILVSLSWVVVAAVPSRRPSADVSKENSKHARLPFTHIALALAFCAPFSILATLAAALPTTDYDALAYHLLGPKEWFLAGRIEFLPHNVYTSFPFLTEMFPLLGMTLLGDWFTGALAGQVILSAFGPLGGLAVFILGRRWFGPTAGLLAAVAYLTTPWIYRLSSIPYVEGAMLAIGTLAIFAASRAAEGPSRWGIVAGMLAGAAFGCKYPALVMVAAPGVLFGACGAGRRGAIPFVSLFATGFLLCAGVWLIRNIVWTGNPVYPLLFETFGGAAWSTELADKFRRGHQSTDFSLATIWPMLADIAVRSDWQSALIFGFAPWAILGARRQQAAALWGLVAGLIAAYWLLTHRLDRFWLPLEPFAAALAGAGMTWSSRPAWKWTVAGAGVLAILFNLADVVSGLCGLTNYTAPLRQQREINIRQFWPTIALANDTRQVQPDDGVLFVGFAAVFDAEPRSRYSTVFNENELERLLARPGSKELKPLAQMRQTLESAGVTLILVDWSWIDRYRSKGNYGFTPFVTPELFTRLTTESDPLLEKVGRWPQGAGQPAIELFRVRPPDR